MNAQNVRVKEDYVRDVINQSFAILYIGLQELVSRCMGKRKKGTEKGRLHWL